MFNINKNRKSEISVNELNQVNLSFNILMKIVFEKLKLMCIELYLKPIRNPCICQISKKVGFVCVCMCVYTLPRVGFFRLHDGCDIHEKLGSTMFCCEYQLCAFCQVSSSLFPNLSYFTSKDVTPARRKTGEKTI